MSIGPWPGMVVDELDRAAAMTVAAMFQRTCDRYADRDAVRTDRIHWTYADLRREVNRTANALFALGVRPGDPVGIWLPNGPEWIVCGLAVAHLGAVTVPVNARLRAPEIAEVLTVTGLSTLITTDRFLTNAYLDILEGLLGCVNGGETAWRSNRFPALARVVAVDGSRAWTVDYMAARAGRADALDPPVARALRQVSASDPLGIFWTSGSTGAPKGAVIGHSVLGNVAAFTRIMKITASDRCLIPSPLFYVAGYLWCMLAPIMCGACMVPLPHLTAQEILDGIEEYRATVLIGVADAHLRLLNDRRIDNRQLTSIRAVYSGGGNLPVSAARELDRLLRPELFYTVYGLTEAGGIVTMTAFDDDLTEVTGSIGFALPGFETSVVDPSTGAPVGDGEPGELWVRGRYVSSRYWASPSQPATDEEGWFHTGDLVSRGPRGRFRFRGRLKDVIKVGGENVSPLEVEALLLAHPDVRAVAVVAVPDPLRGEAVAAAVVLVDDAPGVDVLRAYCRQHLAPFKVPRVIVVLDELPETPTGKIAKREIQLGIRSAAVAAAHPPEKEVRVARSN